MWGLTVSKSLFVGAALISFRARVGALSTLLVGLCACSIHPLPQDVTGVKTATIVHQNRCEARNAVIDAQTTYLRHNGYAVADLNELREIKASKTLNPIVKNNLAYFDTTAIVYSYSLDGTETNGLTFNADEIEPLTHPGTATISPSAANTLMRDNVRTFTISDIFGTLIGPTNDKYCDFEQPGPNLEYPIVGRIGIDEMVTTFIELVTKDDLAAQQDSSKGGVQVGTKPSSSAPIAMVDTITFTTTISAGVTPKISFSPVGHAWQLMDATLASTNMREDKHEVVVGLALSTAPPSGSYRSVQTMYPTTFMTPALITSPASEANGAAATNQQIALTAVNQQIVRFELSKAVIVAP